MQKMKYTLRILLVSLATLMAVDSSAAALSEVDAAHRALLAVAQKVVETNAESLRTVATERDFAKAELREVRGILHTVPGLSSLSLQEAVERLVADTKKDSVISELNTIRELLATVPDHDLAAGSSSLTLKDRLESIFADRAAKTTELEQARRTVYDARAIAGYASYGYAYPLSTPLHVDLMEIFAERDAARAALEGVNMILTAEGLLEGCSLEDNVRALIHRVKAAETRVAALESAASATGS